MEILFAAKIIKKVKLRCGNLIFYPLSAPKFNDLHIKTQNSSAEIGCFYIVPAPEFAVELISCFSTRFATISPDSS
jgi:hypothetical protein